MKHKPFIQTAPPSPASLLGEWRSLPSPRNQTSATLTGLVCPSDSNSHGRLNRSLRILLLRMSNKRWRGGDIAKKRRGKDTQIQRLSPTDVSLPMTFFLAIISALPTLLHPPSCPRLAVPIHTLASTSPPQPETALHALPRSRHPRLTLRHSCSLRQPSPTMSPPQ